MKIRHLVSVRCYVSVICWISQKGMSRRSVRVMHLCYCYKSRLSHVYCSLVLQDLLVAPSIANYHPRPRTCTIVIPLTTAGLQEEGELYKLDFCNVWSSHIVENPRSPLSSVVPIPQTKHRSFQSKDHVSSYFNESIQATQNPRNYETRQAVSCHREK